MDNSPQRILWTQSKTSLYIGIGIVIAVNIGNIIMLSLYWAELESYIIGIIISFVGALIFLWLFALRLEVDSDRLTLKFLFGQKRYKPQDIAEARILKRRGNEYLRLKFNRGYGPRKTFQFAVLHNGQDIADFLNEMMTYSVKVYANATLETQVRFNKQTGQFEYNAS